MSRGLGLLFVLGGVVALVVAAGSALAATVVLGAGSTSAPTTTFAAGDTVTAPGTGGLAGPLVVYGAATEVDGSTTLALGCSVVSPAGTDRAVAATSGEAVEVGGATLVPLVQAEGAKVGDQVRCTGDRAAAFEPLAVGVAAVPGTARVVAAVLAVVAALFGVVLLVVGSRMLRSR